ncbi:MAG TPA: hypothetical protein VHK01_20665 [Lacipirellulaceae bacterium]|jgi:hypothetical protein|nr:hypothetical protein [Lacipirellulaceae bacterium]
MVNRPLDEGPAIDKLQWQAWPLVDKKRWSWMALVGIAAVGAFVSYFGNSWLLASLAMAGLTATLWKFFVPVHYELGSLGLRRSAFGRTTFLAWQAVRAYQVRPTGAVLFSRPDPTAIDLLRCVFVPYPAEEDDALCALREHLTHAVELPE